MVLPYINMNLPQVYTRSPSWTPLPPLTPYHLSGSSPCTSPKHPVSCIEHRLAIRFLHDIIHVSMPFSQIIPPSPSPTESKSLFYISVSLLLSHIQGYHYHLSKFHIYVLVYCIREGDGTPLQYSCLENPMDRGAWQAAVYGVAKSRTRLSDFTSLHKKECIWVRSNEVDETGVCYTEWSKSERKTKIQYINAYIWNLER